MLREVRQSSHYIQRKKERSNIEGLVLPKEAYEGYEFNEVAPKLIEVIKERLFKLLRAFEGKGNDFPGGTLRVLPILNPKLVNKGKAYPIGLKVQYSKGDTTASGKGNVYVVIIRNNTLITLLLIPEAQATESNLERAAKDHIMREEPQLADNPIVVTKTKNTIYDIDIDELIKGKEVGLSQAAFTKEELPYKVRTDYRKGADFVHNDYGKGTIVNTATGIKGQPDPQGKLDWIDVDFGKPFVKGGVFTSVRRIPNVYASAYWLGKA